MPEQALTAAQVIGVATCFRDLHASVLQAAVAARQIDGLPTGSASVQRALDGWASAATLGAALSPEDIEAGLVRMHLWLRATVDAWKASGQLVPLSATHDQLVLHAGEERVVPPRT